MDDMIQIEIINPKAARDFIIPMQLRATPPNVMSLNDQFSHDRVNTSSESPSSSLLSDENMQHTALITPVP